MLGQATAGFGFERKVVRENVVNSLLSMAAFIDINGARLAYSMSENYSTKPLFITLHGGRGFGN